jgi:branched-chain amino acid transport system permease protein
VTSDSAADTARGPVNHRAEQPSAAVDPGRGLSTELTRRAAAGGMTVALVVFLLGLALPDVVTSTYYQGILVSGAVLAFLTLAIAFLAHRSGLISLGHTAFYGSAAYLVAIATTHWGWSPLLAAGVGLVGGTVLAAAIGALVVRAPGMSFVMLTLAFGQALYQISIMDSFSSVTGGFDGLNVTFGANASFLGLSETELTTPSKVWPLVWASLVLVAVILWMVGRSRFGTVLAGIRENEERARFSGYNTYLPRLLAFTLTGAVASLGGVLFAMTSVYVSPDVFSFATAGNALIATIVGGVTTIFGPVLGAGLYTYAQNELSSSGNNIDLYTGIAIIVVLVFTSGGIGGTIVRIARFATSRIRRRWDEWR